MGVVDVSVNDAGLNSLDYVNTILFNFPGGAQIATWNAAKRAGTAGRTVGRKYVIQAYNIKAKTFNEQTNIKVHQEGSGSGTTKLQIFYSGEVIDLLEFNPVVTAGDGVTYQIKRGYMRHLRHAFDVNAYGNRIFQRVGKPRIPIRKEYGPATPQMMKGEVADAMGKRIFEIFNKRLSVEIGRILGR